jgi:hypothetical protein
MRFSRQIWALIIFISLLAGVLYVKDKSVYRTEAEIVGSVIGAAIAFLFWPVVITWSVIGIGQLVKNSPTVLTRRIIFFSVWALSVLILLLL